MPESKSPAIRPIRTRLPDFAGKMKTLPDEAGSWKLIHEARHADALILLGYGPGNPATLPFIKDAEKAGAAIYWLDCEPMLSNIKTIPPAAWESITPQAAVKLAARAKVMFYQPGLALAPDFWGPLLAKIQKAGSPGLGKAKGSGAMAWLPGTSAELLHLELRHALGQKGFGQIIQDIPARPDIGELEKIWRNRLPDLAISVNFRGLDAEGKIFELCRALGAPLAVWLVDNPWNLLSGIGLPWWTHANLFVTDASFMEELRANGARHVCFLPLASSWHMWKEPRAINNGETVFVGRPAFPQRQSFFKGMKLPENLCRIAENMLAANQLPDYHWWSRQLRIPPWPGLAGRKISLGADIFSAKNRSRWLNADMNINIVGGDEWKVLLPNARISQPVDYYGQLPGIYQNALCNLNVTSLLLPQSLSQRHFDVWAAGGFLFSDNTRGLDIFPEELTRPMTLASPHELLDKQAWLKNNPLESMELRMAWRELLEREHQYLNRIEAIMARLREQN